MSNTSVAGERIFCYYWTNQANGGVLKTCNRCRRKLPFDSFGKNSTAKDGLMSRCKECNKNIATHYYNQAYGSKEQRESEQSSLYQYILSLKKQGHTLRQIAQEVGLDKSSISYYLNGKIRVGTLAVRKFKSKLNSSGR